ncbi:hypothetical protein [Merismopedia glauca]|uniref:Uncharacterized protein n=1 Tax=Merismopedia glauca CCAP 1448/3 TaxID=1296344 RepID=A0A2T1C9D2_9CYAN|nr:hypothetical protein [Merismopedia glauca]PSB04885.1 hypothetical protein C7B64_02005 [Merismopedia glauca CCAP 1448/3]
MPRLVGKKSNSIPTVSLLLSFLILTGGLLYYYRFVHPQWLEKEFRNIFPPDSSQKERLLLESAKQTVNKNIIF